MFTDFDQQLLTFLSQIPLSHQYAIGVEGGAVVVEASDIYTAQRVWSRRRLLGDYSIQIWVGSCLYATTFPFPRSMW